MLQKKNLRVIHIQYFMLIYQQDHVSMHCKDVMEPMLAKCWLIFVTKTVRFTETGRTTGQSNR